MIILCGFVLFEMHCVLAVGTFYLFLKASWLLLACLEVSEIKFGSNCLCRMLKPKLIKSSKCQEYSIKIRYLLNLTFTEQRICDDILIILYT